MARPTTIDIDIDPKGVEDASVLAPRQAKKVMAKALTATAKTGRTKAARFIGQSFGLRSTIVRERLTFRRASREDLSASIVAFGRPLTLIKAAKSARQTKQGVKATAYGGRQLYAGTFIATMDSGRRGIFTRATKGEGRVGRLPIRELFGPSVPEALIDDEVSERLSAELSVDLSKKLTREIDRELRRQAGFAG